MTGLETVTIVVVPLLVFVAMVATTIETALIRMSRARAASLADTRPDDSNGDDGHTNGQNGHRGHHADRATARADHLADLVVHRVRSLAPLWFVIAACLVTAATLTAVVVNDRWGGVAVAVLVAAETVIVFLFAWFLPRTRALARLDEVAVAFVPLVRFVGRSPIGLLIRPMARLAGVSGDGEDDAVVAPPPVSERELLAMTDQAARDAAIDEDEQHLIESILEFGDTRTGSVMVPRPDMVTMVRDQTVRDGLALVVEKGFSRFPVVGDGIDDIVGIVHAKDLLSAQLKGQETKAVGDLIRSAHHVPDTKHVAKLLREMQAEMFHLAIVVDEYGGTAGLVTLEDLLEEVVGEIVDEFDVEEPMIEPVPDGARVNGKVALSDLEDLLGEQLPSGDWSTVGGLIFSTLGHVPDEGEEIVLDRHRLKVESVIGRRIARVLIHRAPEASTNASVGMRS